MRMVGIMTAPVIMQTVSLSQSQGAPYAQNFIVMRMQANMLTPWIILKF